MESPTRYPYCQKKMLGWICEKMAIQESTLRGGRFSASNSIAIRNDAFACNDMCVLGRDCLTAAGNGSWDNAHTFDPSNRGEKLGREPNTLVQRAQRMGGSLNG
jgi:hypothetical protein